jgi:hypothetical protein
MCQNPRERAGKYLKIKAAYPMRGIDTEVPTS